MKKSIHSATSDATPKAEMLRDWSMAVLLAIFVALYGLAFAGKLDPFKDNSMLLRIEPIAIILVGYYLGRIPSRRLEVALLDEAARLRSKAEAAQLLKEKAQQERDALEERINNARKALMSSQTSRSDPAVDAAVQILDS